MKVLSEKEIKKLLKEKYNSKDFKFDTKTNQNFIELINALNDEFDIEIQPTQVKPTTWRTVKGIVQMVEELQNEAK